ncbi:MAG: hypothetical protein IKX56_03935, partial [Muribaculaceae bacterium]|nr:hypothetical protein [Muribaculaceae bacterium]
SYVNGAAIQNLVVAGVITGTASRAAGIVGETGSSLSHVTNCLSSVNVSGGQYVGGISVGGNVEITGCVFNGTITGTSMSGGFVGYSHSALVISDCLFAPQEGSTLSGGTFYYNGGGDITPVNSYYTMSLGTSQGKQAHSIAGGEYVTVAFSGQATTYNVSGIIAYSVGISLTPPAPSPEGEGEVFYAGEGDAVSLNLGSTIPDGYTFLGYQASAGTLTGSTNPYTLTMPDADVTVQAVLRKDSIHYMDADSVLHTRSDFTVLTGDETTLEAGWYVVDHDITYDTTLTLNGDVTLILCNGKTMTVTPSSGSGIYGFENSLTLYGQSLDSIDAGTLNVIAGDDWHNSITVTTYSQHSGKVVVGSLGDVAFYAGNCTIHGGSIEVSEGRTGIIARNLTINGGSIYANGSDYGIYVDGSGSVTINGGKMEASRIWARQNITLGWTNTDDYILAGNYEASEGTISVKNGQAFYYEDGNNDIIVSDTLNSSQINAIGGKTLRPRFVNYMDGNGGEHICKNFTLLTGDETTLEAGWYVVDHDINCDSTLTLNGDVNLILCNGKTMTVAPNSGRGIVGSSSSLSVYGQSLDSIAGTLNVTTNDLLAIILDNYTQHSGNIHVNGGYTGISAGILIINGGSINANGADNGVDAGTLIINGGKMFANKIYSWNDITLGWTRVDDYIHAGSYNANYGYGTVSVKRGQAFYYDNNVIVSDTLNSSQIEAIGGKTLRPYIVPVTLTKDIAGYGDSDGGWQLIALPMYGNLNPATVGNLIADTVAHYDLYRFEPSHEGNEWENYKSDNTFMLETGKGYLYANKNNVTLTFSGPAYIGNSCEIALVYDSTDYQKCWNLVGNPFDCNATLDRPYYVLSAGGLDINPEPIPATTPIPPCTAVFVKAVEEGDAAVFTKVIP